MINKIKKLLKGKIKECRWCGNKYFNKNSEHKNLCSDKCFIEENQIQ